MGVADQVGQSLKAWLEPVALTRRDFRPREINAIAALVEEHRAVLLETWREHFG